MAIKLETLLSDPTNLRLASGIREHRRRCGLSFERVAALLGLSVRQYVDRESARVKFSAEELEIITLVLGMDKPIAAYTTSATDRLSP